MSSKSTYPSLAKKEIFWYAWGKLYARKVGRTLSFKKVVQVVEYEIYFQSFFAMKEYLYFFSSAK